MSDSSPNQALKLTRDEMLTLGRDVVDIIVSHFESLSEKPVARKMDRPSIKSRLREPLPEQGVDIGTVVRRVQEDILANIVHNDHPRCFSFIPGPSNFVSVMADALASGFNVIAADWLEASGPSEIELITVDWLRQLCALPEAAGGLFVSGGSMANLISLRTARRARLRDETAGAVVYCSDQTHYSIDRALQLLGFEVNQLRKLPSDDLFRLSVTRLKQEVAADRAAGKVPFCVVANAGTPNTGAVDPLIETAEVCKQEGLCRPAGPKARPRGVAVRYPLSPSSTRAGPRRLFSEDERRGSIHIRSRTAGRAICAGLALGSQPVLNLSTVKLY